MRLWFILLLIISFLPSSHAQTSQLTFEKFGIEAGLSALSVRALLQDHYGFIWIGTLDGLDKYDGYSLKAKLLLNVKLAARLSVSFRRKLFKHLD